MKRLAVALQKHLISRSSGRAESQPACTLNGDADGERVAAASSASAEAPAGSSLRHLHLDANGLSSEACRAIRAAIRDGPCLDELSLSRNPLGPEGVARMAVGNVACLRLAGVQAGPAGATAVARALRSSRCRIACLDLADNAIGPEGARAIGDALPRCLTLRELSLERNGLGEAGARELVERAASGGGCALEVLGLKGNDVGPAGAEALAASLAGAFGALTSLDIQASTPPAWSLTGVRSVWVTADAG